MSRNANNKNRHLGSTFDSFLEEIGIKEEVDAAVAKRLRLQQKRKRVRDRPDA